MKPNLIVLSLLTLLTTSVASASPPENVEPDLKGVWKTVYLSMEDPRWTISDLACSGWCSLEAYRYLQTLLDNPANKEIPVKELLIEAQEYGKKHLAALLTAQSRKEQSEYDPADDPAVDCSPEGDGLRHQITAPLLMEIGQENESITIRYEYWNALRTIYMDGRAHPVDANPDRLGHSVGHYEDGSLVIETTQFIPMLISLPGGYISSSPGSLFIERYTRRGDRLELVWEIIDPLHFTKPYQGEKAWLFAPDWELEEFTCEAITGEY